MKATAIVVLGLAHAPILAALTGLASALASFGTDQPTESVAGAGMSHHAVSSRDSTAANNPTPTSGRAHYTRNATRMADLSASPFVSSWMRGYRAQQVRAGRETRLSRMCLERSRAGSGGLGASSALMSIHRPGSGSAQVTVRAQRHTDN